MHTELHCGFCDSYLQMESMEEDAVWLLVHRFTDAHVACGFISPTTEDAPIEYQKKVIKPRLKDESEEA